LLLSARDERAIIKSKIQLLFGAEQKRAQV
jgi:hypothetical protein